MFKIETNKDLTALNTLGFTARAEFYCKISCEDDLLKALAFVQTNKLSYQILSGGSNLLIAERVQGLTLHMQIEGIERLALDDKSVLLRVACGENWHRLVEYTVDNQWQGIETLALIPGLVGAAPVQNIGAYGSEVKDVLLKVRAFDLTLMAFIELNVAQCEFGYRDSIFKRNAGRYIITSVEIKLSKSYQIDCGYSALEQYFLENDIPNPTLVDVYTAICCIRTTKLPDPDKVPNAGSFFKNPLIPLAHFIEIKAKNPKIIGYKVAEGSIKVAAGWLVQDCGWKGYQADGVGVYSKQALVLIHTGGSQLADLLALAAKIQDSVYQKYAIRLEIEPQHFPAK